VTPSSPTIERQHGVAQRLVDAASRLLDQAEKAIYDQTEPDGLVDALIGAAYRIGDRAGELHITAWRASGEHWRADRLEASQVLLDAISAPAPARHRLEAIA
jgi:hypothetical protein